MKLDRLSTAATTAWGIALCMVVVVSGVFLLRPDDGAEWSGILWVSVAGAWIAVVVGFVLQRKFVHGVRAQSQTSH